MRSVKQVSRFCLSHTRASMRPCRDWLKRAVLSAVSWLLLALVCFASADPFLDGQIKNLEHKIVLWKNNSHLVGSLIFVVFFIGLALTALQSASREPANGIV